MFKQFLRFCQSIRYLRYYIIADATDNSITFSRKLYRHITASVELDAAAKVIVFFIPECKCYGFMINPPVSEKDTQIADIQYNDLHMTIGFESLCPTVNRIFYDYGIGAISNAKLSVTPSRTADGKIFYKIERPDL